MINSEGIKVLLVAAGLVAVYFIIRWAIKEGRYWWQEFKESHERDSAIDWRDGYRPGNDFGGKPRD